MSTSTRDKSTSGKPISWKICITEVAANDAGYIMIEAKVKENNNINKITLLMLTKAMLLYITITLVQKNTN